MKHPEIIVNNETPFETGERSTYLRYDSLEKMLRGQFVGLTDQSIKDGEKEQKQLEALGKEAAVKINEAADIVASMWRISEPYMETSLPQLRDFPLIPKNRDKFQGEI